MTGDQESLGAKGPQSLPQTVRDQSLIVVGHSEGVLQLGLNRPEKRNALSLALVDELRRVIDNHRHDPAVLVLSSTTPGMFIAGADIAELNERGEEEAFRAFNVELFNALAGWRWPSIAAIDGPAYGGGLECALACDLRVASPRARFAQPELGLGILAGAGGNWRLPELVGLGVARKMLYLGEVIDATRALSVGLVDDLCDDPVIGALRWAETIRTKPWRALEITKLALRTGGRPSTGLIDVLGQAILFESEEKRTRMGTFLDRRR
ncbi:enoyl-CoA hydratase/isomerase family protein [Ferrimicrobium sp.]|uniref:enoyl-CoA hydratase/isomerase family protein n=1 Tax=Ferrimicrobium sp. TaxID=2926050 RepID=UPI002637DBD7|nr:enoyl-CoA hydratase/isomerase family protein [Ferrimicrobium sp.]